MKPSGGSSGPASSQDTGPETRSGLMSTYVDSDVATPGATVDLVKTQCKNNPDFVVFLSRMRATKRRFFVRESKGGPVILIALPMNEATKQELPVVDIEEPEPGEDVPQFPAEILLMQRKWLLCCLREYIDRNRIFKRRFGTSVAFLLRILMIVSLVATALYFLWPLWDRLIDIEADALYKTLDVSSSASPSEIKKAYREQVKRWHPDKNPTCGDYCRSRMIEIQQAHDVLLAKGDRRMELANRYKEELMQLRSLVFFRVYEIAFHAAQLASDQLLSLLSLDSRGGRDSELRWPLQFATRIFVVAIFTAQEIFFINGFQLVILLQLFYHVVNIVRSTAAQREVEQIARRSYFDASGDIMRFIVPAVAIHTMQFFYGNGVWGMPLLHHDGLIGFLFQFFFGAAYIGAHLFSFAPNLVDNYHRKKFSLPLGYMKFPAGTFSWVRFGFMEFGVVIDDIFAFTCRVPAVYRVVVLLIHAAFLTQFALLPWDSPVMGRMQRAYQKKQDGREATDSASTSAGKQTGTADAGSTAATAGSDSRTSGTSASASSGRTERDVVVRRVPTSLEEDAVFHGLDAETTVWLHIPLLRHSGYTTLLQTIMTARHRNAESFQSDILADTDLQTLGVQYNIALPNNRVLTERSGWMRDPYSNEIVIRERGLTRAVMWNPTKNDDVALTIQRCKQKAIALFGAGYTMSMSQKWAARATDSSWPVPWKLIPRKSFDLSLRRHLYTVYLFLTLLIFTVAVMYVRPQFHSEIAFTYPFENALSKDRYRLNAAGDTSPFDHALGASTVDFRPLITPDAVDASRQLRLYATPNSIARVKQFLQKGRAAHSEEAERQYEKPEAPGGGDGESVLSARKRRSNRQKKPKAQN